MKDSKQLIMSRESNLWNAANALMKAAFNYLSEMEEKGFAQFCENFFIIIDKEEMEKLMEEELKKTPWIKFPQMANEIRKLAMCRLKKELESREWEIKCVISSGKEVMALCPLCPLTKNEM